MKVNVLHEDKKAGKCQFILEGANPTVANTLRRTILEHVPTMAIEDVSISKNSSILYDEVIAHRLGLIPLTTDLETYELPSMHAHGGKDNPKVELHLQLSAKGPGIVYSGDLQSKDPKVRPVHSKIPITKLLKGQELEIDCVAVLGIGKTHMKWSPGHCWYKNCANVQVKNEQKAKEIAEQNPMKNTEYLSPELDVKAEAGLKHNIPLNIMEQHPSVFTITFSDTDFVFYLESWGQLSCKEILLKAIDVINNKLEDFDKSLKGLTLE